MKIFFPIAFLFLLSACSKSEVEPQPTPPDEEVDPPVVAPRSVPSIRSFTQIEFTATTEVKVPKPAGAKPGDLPVAIMAKDGNTNSKPSIEEGWVRIVSQFYGSGVPLIRAWWKQVVAEDGETYQFSPGSTTQSGRIDLLCVKNWNGSAPTAVSTTATGSESFEAPSVPVISPSAGDLLLGTVAVAAPSGLEQVVWSNVKGFKELTKQSASKVTMATAAKENLQESLPATVSANRFTTTLPSERRAALLSFIVPAESKRPIVRIYRGGASRTIGAGGVELYETSQALVSLLSDPDLEYDVRSIGENETDKITADHLRNAALYVQPGGPVIEVGWPYVQDRKETIRTYLDDGGKYLGVCLGAYFFRNYYSGKSFELLPPGNYAYTYSSLAGSPYDGAGADTAKVLPHNEWGSGERYLTISGANYFYCPLPVPDLTNLATYVYPQGVKARAAICFSFNPNNDDKKGWVIGIGPHPEADDTWRNMEDPDGLDHDLIIRSVKDLLKR